jgi:hypothetical protein
VKVHEEHARVVSAASSALIDDPRRIWPTDRWPELRADGFGFLRHELDEHRPGERITYRITGPRGLSGVHGWTLRSENGNAVLRHFADVECRGLMRLAWPLVVAPIHDAVHEDVLDRAEGAPPRPWSRRVRLIRWALGRLR